MALNKQKVALPLSLNLDTKSDDNQQPPGTLRKIENFTFDSPGKLQKRNGFDEINLKDTSSVAIAGSQKLAKFKNELLVIDENDKLYSQIKATNQWNERATVTSLASDTLSVIRSNENQENLDCTHTSGLDILVSTDSSGVNLSIVDNSNDNIVIQKTLISASGTSPRVISRNNEVYIFYIASNNIKFKKFDIFQFNTISSESTAVSNLNVTNSKYDVEVIGDKIILAYNNTTGSGVLAFAPLDTNDTLGSEVEVGTENADGLISLAIDSASRIICVYYNNTDIKAVGYSASLGVEIVAPTSLETVANVTNATITESTTGNYTAFYEISAASTSNHLIRTNTINTAATIGTPSVFARSVGLASKAFTRNSSPNIITIHASSLQSTYFILNGNAEVIGKISSDDAGTVISNSSLPKTSLVSTDKYLFAGQIKSKILSDTSTSTFYTSLGASKTIINFNPSSKYETAALGETLHIAAGVLKMYDGSSVVEHGFHLYPETLTAGSTATTGGNIADGTYQYVAIYTWQDSLGNMHRSAPSLALEVTLSGGTGTQTQTITVPTLRLTDKTDASIEIYRTEDAGTIFYKITSPIVALANDPTADTVSFVDSSSDSDLIDNELLYTTGGVLDNIAAPSLNLIETWKNRIFTANPGSGKLAYSKIRLEGSPVEFNDTLTITLPSKGGNVSALKAMDDKLIIFKENAIYYISGDGPNNLGEQDTFIEAELISSEIGCQNENSVVLAPMGILFKSPKGIYLLDHALSLSYFGSPVEQYNNLTITSAVSVSHKNQIRFTTLEKECIVYNYHENKWSTFQNFKALSAVYIDNIYYYLRPDNLIYKEDSSYTDNGTYIKSKVESGWLSFDGTQGYQRVYRLIILGNFASDHKIKVKVAYNHINAWTQEITVDAADFSSSTAYGDSSPYGSEATYGSSNQYQFRIDLAKQKCESIKISIEDIQSTAGQGMSLSGILFVVGVKGTDYKIAQSQQYGSE
jgi:hypothetical protein